MRDSVTRQRHALKVTMALGQELKLSCDEAHVVKDSNNTVVHLAPAPVVAKVGTSTVGVAAARLTKELDIGHFLASEGAPIAPPTDDIPSGPHRKDNTIITLWTFIDHDPGAAVSDGQLAETLKHFHRAFADYPGGLPDFAENLVQAEALLRDASQTPVIDSTDRRFLIETACNIRSRLSEFNVGRLPLHGEPHLDGNILKSSQGPLLIDLEAACIGPYEWDLTALEAAQFLYSNLDDELLAVLSQMRSLCVSTWCWAQYGRAPEVDEAAHIHLRLLRNSAGRLGKSGALKTSI